LRNRGVIVERQKALPLYYRSLEVDTGYRIDLLLGQQVVVELKSVESFQQIHSAQLLSYLKLGNFRLGYLLNFNVVRMKDGIKRMLNGY
jgi:GxxExxY protein